MTWEEHSIVDADDGLPGHVWHLAIHFNFLNTTRSVFAAGPGEIWYSEDVDSATWHRDRTPPLTTFGSLAGPCYPGTVCRSPAPMLAIDPQTPRGVYLASEDVQNGNQSNGPAFFYGTPPDGVNDPTKGGSTLWYGDYSTFSSPSFAAAWQHLPDPPVLYGSGFSGRSFVRTNGTFLNSGYLLLFGDGSDIYETLGLPSSHAAWHRLTGSDVVTRANRLSMHVDPQLAAVSQDYKVALTPCSGPTPYNDCQTLVHASGTIWINNDGGTFHSEDGGSTWALGDGFTTTSPGTVAGVAVPGQPPALYMGTGDNDDFFTLDGGCAWGDANPDRGCGDCGDFFTDAGTPWRVLNLAPRISQGFVQYQSGNSRLYADASDLAEREEIVCPANCTNGVEGFFGYRPVIQTLLGEAEPLVQDMVVIGNRTDGARALFRTNGSLPQNPSEWELIDSFGRPRHQVGPRLPACPSQFGGEAPDCVNVVQTSGGHQDTQFYVGSMGDPNAGTTGQLWKLESTFCGLGQTTPCWRQLVPNGSVLSVERFFVNPYDTGAEPRVYVLDWENGVVWRSDSGGNNFMVDQGLTSSVTAGATYAVSGDFVPMLQDMQFARNGSVRVALGTAGVFYTRSGLGWAPVFSTGHAR
jgi:hypothetical protein